MIKLKLLAGVIALALLGGCSTLQAVAQPVPTAAQATLEQSTYAAKLTFEATLVGAVAYIELPRCGRPASPKICSQQNVVDVMRKAITSADASVQAAENAVRAIKQDTTVLQALVSAAQQSVGAFKVITDTYKAR